MAYALHIRTSLPQPDATKHATYSQCTTGAARNIQEPHQRRDAAFVRNTALVEALTAQEKAFCGHTALRMELCTQLSELCQVTKPLKQSSSVPATISQGLSQIDTPPLQGCIQLGACADNPHKVQSQSPVRMHNLIGISLPQAVPAMYLQPRLSTRPCCVMTASAEYSSAAHSQFASGRGVLVGYIPASSLLLCASTAADSHVLSSICHNTQTVVYAG